MTHKEKTELLRITITEVMKNLIKARKHLDEVDDDCPWYLKKSLYDIQECLDSIGYAR